MNIVIHHNPDCGTSRNVLAIIESAGYHPIVIEYLKTGWTLPQLRGLFAAADPTPRAALRTTKSPAAEMALLDPDIGDEVTGYGGVTVTGGYGGVTVMWWTASFAASDVPEWVR